MKMRFHNILLLTMEKEKDVFKGELWVEGNRITYVGKGKPSDKNWDREIDGEGNLVMPGFKNAHAHSPMTFLRSFADDKPLFSWLHETVFPIEAKLTGEDVYWFTKLGILEYLTSGITCSGDMYFYSQEMAKAHEEMGFRAVIFDTVNDHCQSMEEIKKNYEYYNRNSGDGRISYRLCFHGEYTTKESILKELSAFAHEHQEPVYCHCSETKGETEDCVKRWGKTPVKVLSDLGLFDFGGGIYHGVYLTEEDMELLKRQQVSVVTNPGSNGKLASGIAPLEELVQKGINVAIGTDGPASNNALDFFREMYLATVFQKLQNEDAASMQADKVLEMATIGGAKAMGLTDCDVLKEGKLADFIMLNLHMPNMQPIHQIPKNIVYSGSKANVKMTVVDGKILYEDGNFYVGEPVEEIYMEVQRRAKRLTDNG